MTSLMNWESSCVGLPPFQSMQPQRRHSTDVTHRPMVALAQLLFLKSLLTLNSRAWQKTHSNVIDMSRSGWKTLRHPHLLAFQVLTPQLQDGIDSPDRIVVVTEPVLPLKSDESRETMRQFPLSISWGLSCVLVSLACDIPRMPWIFLTRKRP